ncbi:MAG: serine/threonine protein kinase [Planctomycetes bacterium]|nr:serine/threonine protein kinase [Planctomycetota bacterium]
MSEVIGPYRIERELGRGGMGVVYIGVHAELGRRAAIKVLLDQKVGEERFWRECEGMGRLAHPGIVGTYEAGLHEGRPYLAMELVDGRSLREVLVTTGPWPSRKAAELGVALSDAMAHVHAEGLLHRDLKPENILIDPAGQAKITDFGLVRGVGADSLTATGTMLGTPAFMPPEQAEGEKNKLGPPSDVYGLGATLFAVLTGVPPFEGASPYAIVAQVFNKPAPTPSSLQAGVDPALDAIVLRCLAKDPVARYPDAAALADVLRSYLAGEYQAPPASRRLLVPVLSALVVLAIALGGFLAWRVSTSGQETPAEDPQAARPTASKALDDAAGEVPKLAAWLVHYATEADAELVTRARRELATVTLEAITETGATGGDPAANELSGLHLYRNLSVWLRDHEKFADPKTREKAQRQQPDWHPETPLPILALLRGEPIQKSEKPSRPRDPLVLIDGLLLTFGRKPKLKVWDLGVGAREIAFTGGGLHSALAAAQAGEEVLLTVGTDLFRLAPGTLEIREQVSLKPLIGEGIVRLPDGKILVFGRSDDKSGGGWTLVPSQDWPKAVTPTKIEGTPVRAGLYDQKSGNVYLTGGSGNMTGRRTYFLRRYRYTDGTLQPKETVAPNAAGYHLRTLAGGRILVGLNRASALIYEGANLNSQAPVELSLVESGGIDALALQCLGSLPLPGGGLLLSADAHASSYGKLSYFDPDQIASGKTEVIFPRWITKLPFRPRSLTQSADGSLIFLGTASGYVAVLPRFKLPQ